MIVDRGLGTKKNNMNKTHLTALFLKNKGNENQNHSSLLGPQILTDNILRTKMIPNYNMNLQRSCYFGHG